jgi:hypothetical protein
LRLNEELISERIEGDHLVVPEQWLRKVSSVNSRVSYGQLGKFNTRGIHDTAKLPTHLRPTVRFTIEIDDIDSSYPLAFRVRCSERLALLPWQQHSALQADAIENI